MHFLQNSEAWSRQIKKNSERGTRVEMRTHKRSYRSRWFHELDSELSDEIRRNIGNNVVFTKVSSCIKEAGSNLHRQFQRVHKSLSIFTMDPWHTHPSSLRSERSGRKSRPQSERRGSCRISAKRTTRRMVGLYDGTLLLHAQRARQDGRWQDSIREEIWPEIWRTINLFWNVSEYIPITAKDKSRAHQFGKTTLKGTPFRRK